MFACMMNEYHAMNATLCFFYDVWSQDRVKNSGRIKKVGSEKEAQFIHSFKNSSVPDGSVTAEDLCSYDRRDFCQ